MPLITPLRSAPEMRSPAGASRLKVNAPYLDCSPRHSSAIYCEPSAGGFSAKTTESPLIVRGRKRRSSHAANEMVQRSAS